MKIAIHKAYIHESGCECRCLVSRDDMESPESDVSARLNTFLMIMESGKVYAFPYSSKHYPNSLLIMLSVLVIVRDLERINIKLFYFPSRPRPMIQLVVPRHNHD